MSELEKQPSDPPPPSSTPFVEVTCKASGVTRRFAPGTKAGFALSVINNKLDADVPPGSYIEAVKDDEESISFGPSSVLLSYGTSWKLQTVIDAQPGVKKYNATQASSKPSAKKQVSEQPSDLVYFGKILLAFLFIFVLGGIFLFALEVLPIALSLLNTSM